MLKKSCILRKVIPPRLLIHAKPNLVIPKLTKANLAIPNLTNPNPANLNLTKPNPAKPNPVNLNLTKPSPANPNRKHRHNRKWRRKHQEEIGNENPDPQRFRMLIRYIIMVVIDLLFEEKVFHLFFVLFSCHFVLNSFSGVVLVSKKNLTSPKSEEL